MNDFLVSFALSFIPIFVIMDPFPSIVPFLSLTRKYDDPAKRMCATRAVVIAGVIALLFLFAGIPLLGYLHITLDDFRIAGGIILALLGLETILGFSFNTHPEKEQSVEDIALLIATPLLTGPGLVSSLIILSQVNGFLVTLVALLVALALSWIILTNSIRIKALVGDRIIQVAAKIVGMLLLALGVAYIKTGLLGA